MASPMDAISLRPITAADEPFLCALYGSTRTEELAVMVDTFRPLTLTTHAVALEDEQYPFSWTK